MAAMQSRLSACRRQWTLIAILRQLQTQIENWWSHNKKGYTGWLINFFKGMLATGEFNLGNTLHMELASYTFSPLVQYEPDQAKLQWNTHYIRGTRNDTIRGRADKFFFLPELSGVQLNMSYAKRIASFNLLEGRTGTIYTYFGKVKHAIINNKRFCFYFRFLHCLYQYKQNMLKQVKTVPVLKTSLLNIK